MRYQLPILALAFACLVPLLACSDDDHQTSDATTSDTTTTGDAAHDVTTSDATNTSDAAHDATILDGPIPTDSSTPLDGPQGDTLAKDLSLGDLKKRDLPTADSATEDQALPDITLDGTLIDPGPVQCRENTDCAMGQTCNRNAPGGICQGCGTCLDPIEFECVFASCVRDCHEDGDCNAGMRCSSQLYCVIRSCSTNNPCPAPYACVDGKCARPACGVGGSCPTPLLCITGVCIEP